MGQQIASMRAALNVADNAQEREKEEQLRILQQMVDSKLNQFEKEIEQQFLNKEAVRKRSVPGNRALRFERFSTCEISEKPADDISNAIDSFFGKKDEKTGKKEHDVAVGFKSLVTSALNIILGNSSIGQHSEEKYFVYFMHNSIVRIDLRLWRWNFEGNGFMSKYKSALGYIFCVSVVDLSVLTTTEFVFLISEYAGDDPEVSSEYISRMKSLYKEARELSGLSSSKTRAIE